MSKLEHTVYLGLTDAGTFVAASNKSPFFCFEGKTEDEAQELARKALNFFHGAEGKIVSERPIGVEARLSKVVRKKVVTLQAVA